MERITRFRIGIVLLLLLLGVDLLTELHQIFFQALHGSFHSFSIKYRAYDQPYA